MLLFMFVWGELRTLQETLGVVCGVMHIGCIGSADALHFATKAKQNWCIRLDDGKTQNLQRLQQHAMHVSVCRLVKM